MKCFFCFLQFIVFKYLNDDGTELDDEEDIFYDIGLAKWIITDIDDKMITKIKWPPLNPSTLVKKEAPSKLDWPEQFIRIKRFYGKYNRHYLFNYILRFH